MIKKMANKSIPDKQFHAALCSFMADKSKNPQKRIAPEANISASYMSQVVGGVRRASNDVQDKISNVFGYEHADFLLLGKKQLEDKGTLGLQVIAFPTINEPTAAFQKKEPGTSAADSFDDAANDLKEIFNSGNQVLIKAIQANLTAFKVAAVADKEKRDMKSRMEKMEKKLNRLEVENKELKGCAGGSPPLTLTPDNCAPTGTEDPET